MLGAIMESAEPALRARLSVASKVNPFLTHQKTLSAESVRTQLGASLKALGLPKLQLLYLHSPDPSTPIRETLAAAAELYKQGAFEELGLSNYQAWEVAHIHALCAEHGLPAPTVYQGESGQVAAPSGAIASSAAAISPALSSLDARVCARLSVCVPRPGMYNAVTREVERELLPCLRALGMRFYAYNPLAGGLLTGKYTRAKLESTTEGRFRLGNELYRGRYLHPAQLDASEAFAKAAADAGIAPSHAALRWLRHHSALRASNGDGVIVGASRPDHLDDNLAGLEEGPLPPAVLAAADEGWEGVRCAGCVPSYERGTSKYN
jgi:aflatoxin B1 aldehyde reductase